MSHLIITNGAMSGWMGVSAPFWHGPNGSAGLAGDSYGITVSLGANDLSHLLQADRWMTLQHPYFTAVAHDATVRAAQLQNESAHLLRRAIRPMRRWDYNPDGSINLAQVGALLMKAGRRRKGRALLRVAMERAAGETSSFHRACAHREIAVTLAKAGMHSEALGFMREAMQVAKGRRGWGSYCAAIDRDWSQMGVAESMAELSVILRAPNLLLETRQFVQEIRTASHFAAQEPVAVKAVELGLILNDRNLVTLGQHWANTLRDGEYSCLALGAIALLLAKAQMMAEAKACLRQAEESQPPLDARGDLVVKLATIGMMTQDQVLMQKARNLARDICERARLGDMYGLPGHMAQAGVILKEPAWLQWAQRHIGHGKQMSEYSLVPMKCDVAVKMVAAGMQGEAETFFTQIWNSIECPDLNPVTRSETHGIIARKLAEAGLTQAAHSRFREGAAFLTDLKSTDSYSAAAGDFVPQLAQAARHLKDRNLLQLAYQIAASIEEDEGWRREALAKVGFELAQFGVLLLDEARSLQK